MEPALSFDLQSHLLSAIIFQPLAIGIGLLLLELVGGLLASRTVQFSGAIWRGVGLVSSLLGGVAALELWRRFDPTAGGLQLVERVPWLGDQGIHYFVGVDGISILMVALTSALFPVVLLATRGEIVERVRHFVLFMLVLQTGLLGAFLSLNLFLFYVFWEAVLVPVYFIVGMGRAPAGEDAPGARAALRLLVYSTPGSLLMLVGIVILAVLHYQHFGVFTFDWIGVDGATGIWDTPVALDTGPWWMRQPALLAAFGLAFAIRTPLVPLHGWIADAHVAAPTAAAAMMAAVLLKLGAYGLVRFALPAFPEAVVMAAPCFSALAVVGIVYGALLALAQSDAKRLLAFASISQMGFVVLGIFALNPAGLEGALLQMVNHGLFIGALFLLVGMLDARRGQRDLDAFGGLAKIMPRFATLFTIAALAGTGLPALGGFVGELLILVGAFGSRPGAAGWASLGLLLGAAYMLSMLRRIFAGPLDDDGNRGLHDLGVRELSAILALVIPLFWIGLHPTFFLNRIDRSANELLERMAARGAVLPAGAGIPGDAAAREAASDPRALAAPRDGG